MCVRLSVSTRALILGASSLAFSVSGLFTVAASRAGGASPADGTVGQILYHNPTPEPFQPTALNCACVFTAFWVGEKKVLSAEFHTLTRQGLDHSPCTTPLSYTPSSPHILCHSSNPPLMGLLINSWSCDGCVHRCVWMFECSCPKVCTVCSSTVDRWSNKTIDLE